MRRIVYLLPLCALTASALCANTVEIRWQGTISSTAVFNDTELPAGVIEGAVISGVLIFDRDGYSKESNILGSHEYGTRYTYTGTVTQKFSVAGLEWSTSDTQLSLSGQYPMFPGGSSSVVFEAFSSSHSEHSYNQFPDFAGDFEMGFYLMDNIDPFKLINQTYELETVYFRPEYTTIAKGSLSTRHFNDNYDILSGYIAYFDIDLGSIEISGAVPEPSTYAAILATGVLLGTGCLRRYRAKH